MPLSLNERAKSFVQRQTLPDHMSLPPETEEGRHFYIRKKRREKEKNKSKKVCSASAGNAQYFLTCC